MENLQRLLEQHEFLKGLSDEQRRLLVACVKNVRFREGEFLLRENQLADVFYLLRSGRVALELNAPSRGPIRMETLEPNDILGVEWLLSRRVHLDARAVETTIALAFDGACLRGKMDTDPVLGYALTRRMLAQTYRRLEHARLARADVYKGA